MPLHIVREDIIKMRVDAIVNSTNEEMVGYSGVDLAIHRAAGEELDLACKKLAPLGLGMAVMTDGYRLPARHIIHTSGPVYRDGLQGERAILRSCYLECLRVAQEAGLSSIAFPLISSGAYGYPKDQVLTFAVQTISEYLQTHEMMVYLCVFDRTSYTFSKELFADITRFLGEDAPAEEPTDCLEKRCEKRAEPLTRPSVSAPESSSSSSRDDGVFAFFQRVHREPPLRPSVEASDTSDDSFSLDDFDELFDDAPPSRSVLRLSEEGSAKGKTLQEYIRQTDRSFCEMLFDLIDERGMSDVECYKRANVDKRIFSKIRSNKDYRPSKPTAIAFAISLRLDLGATQALLATAGYTLSRSFVFDKIICYFIQNEKYNIFEINEALFEFDQTPLGGF